MTELQPGQNLALNDSVFSVKLIPEPAASALELDASGFLLTSSGKVSGDEGFLFYGQPSVANGAASLNAAQREYTFDLKRLPANVEKVALALTIDQGIKRGQRFGQLGSVTLALSSASDALRFKLDTANMNETAIILGECYLRGGVWKFRAVGQGFNGGLGPLAAHFGVTIKDDPDQPPVPVPAPVALPAAVPPAATPPTPTINLNKVTLEKKKPVSLTKEGGNFGEILVNLNWTRGQKKSGWFGGGSGGIDLDLGCMIEFQGPGRTVIQALGSAFGNYQQQPWAQLMGDDRSGANVDGEFLRINGAHWKEFRRVLIFAFIYEGVPNWAGASGVVSVKIPGQPELITKMDSHSASQTMCAVAMLENDRGNILATKLVEYFADHEKMDGAYGFGFRWKAGSK